MSKWTDDDRKALRAQWRVFLDRSDAECNAALDKRPDLIAGRLAARSTRESAKKRSSKRGTTREEKGGEDRSED